MRLEFDQSTAFSVVDTTYFGVLFMKSAPGSSSTDIRDQKEANSS